MEITPEMQELIDSKIEEARTLFEDEKNKLVNNSKKLLNEKKNLEDRLNQFADVDPDEFRQLKQLLKDKEDEDLLKSGKIDELVNKRVQGVRIELENKLKEKDDMINQLDSTNKNLNSKFDNYRINDVLISEARAAKMLDSALDDLKLRASGVFSFDENGNVVAFDKDGNIKTVDGQALTPKNFIQQLKKAAPHFWPSSEGGNLRGSGDDGTPYGRGSAADEAARSGDMARYRKARQQQRRG